MSASFAHISIDDAGLKRKMAAALEALDPHEMRQTHEIAAGLAKHWVTQQFDGEGGEHFYVSPWKQIDVATAEQRQRLGFRGFHPILVRTGRLKDSFDIKVASDNSGWSVGTNIEYAAYHQEGTPKMDARPMIGNPTVAELRKLSRIYHDHVKDKMK